MLPVSVRIFCIIAVTMLPGCGLKGPLTLPPQPEQTAMQSQHTTPVGTLTGQAIAAPAN